MEIGADSISVYSSEIKGNKQKLEDAIITIGEVERVLIFARQNPRGNILDVSGGTKQKTDIPYIPRQLKRRKQKRYNYYSCHVTGKTDLKKIIRLIKLKINCIHWIQFQ